MLAVCLAFVPLSYAHATSMVMLEVDQQAEESHAFVEAVVGESEVVVTERMVYTDTVLTIVDVIGGDAPQEVILRQAGGVLPERTVFLPGDARLEPGDRIAAFVRGRQGRWYFTALGQSVWHVEGRSVLRELDTDHLMERDATGRVVPATQSPMQFDTLDQLIDAVRDVSFGGAL